MATKNVSSKMRDINGNSGDFGSGENFSSTNKEPSQAGSKTASSQGDYIDFEEIK